MEVLLNFHFPEEEEMKWPYMILSVIIVMIFCLFSLICAYFGFYREENIHPEIWTFFCGVFLTLMVDASMSLMSIIRNKKYSLEDSDSYFYNYDSGQYEMGGPYGQETTSMDINNLK